MPSFVSRAAQVGVCAFLFAVGRPMPADTPPPVPQDVKVYSPDRHFYLVSVLHGQRTSVFRAGSRTPLWELPFYASALYLADDGKHLMRGYEGNIFDGRTQASDAFMTFYTGPHPTATITVGQIFPRWRDLPRSTSGWAWGDFWGYESPSRFILRLVDGHKLAFNPETGTQLPR